MDDKIKAILIRFPQYNERIMKQIQENEDFKDLCSDYGICIDTLKTLENETDRKNAKLEKYREIKIELEQEVLKYL